MAKYRVASLTKAMSDMERILSEMRRRQQSQRYRKEVLCKERKATGVVHCGGRAVAPFGAR